jgi:hypothetical protein
LAQQEAQELYDAGKGLNKICIIRKYINIFLIFKVNLVLMNQYLFEFYAQEALAN